MPKLRRMGPAHRQQARDLAVSYAAYFERQQEYDTDRDSVHLAQCFLGWARMLLRDQEKTGVWLLERKTVEDRIAGLERQIYGARKAA